LVNLDFKSIKSVFAIFVIYIKQLDCFRLKTLGQQ